MESVAKPPPPPPPAGIDAMTVMKIILGFVIVAIVGALMWYVFSDTSKPATPAATPKVVAPVAKKATTTTKTSVPETKTNPVTAKTEPQAEPDPPVVQPPPQLVQLPPPVAPPPPPPPPPPPSAAAPTAPPPPTSTPIAHVAVLTPIDVSVAIGTFATRDSVTIGGQKAFVGMRVLLLGQTDRRQNGIWVIVELFQLWVIPDRSWDPEEYCPKCSPVRHVPVTLPRAPMRRARNFWSPVERYSTRRIAVPRPRAAMSSVHMC